MDKELYIGVDVSKKTLDLAYYDGETIDWKNAHIKVSNDTSGFKEVASWLAKIANRFDNLLFCMNIQDSIAKISGCGWRVTSISMVWLIPVRCIVSSQTWMQGSVPSTV